MEDEDFVFIMGVIDGKLTVQKKNTKTSILIDNYYKSEIEKKSVNIVCYPESFCLH